MRTQEQMTGGVPINLSAYESRSPGLRDAIDYGTWTESKRVRWSVGYHVGSEAIYHVYTPDFGWSYQDD